MTKTISSTGVIVLVVLLLFCFPLFWLPLVMDSCKEDVRKCAACGIKLG